MILKKRVINWVIIAYVLALLTLSVAAINSNKQVILNTTKVLNIRSDYLLHALLFIPWMVLISWRFNEHKSTGFFMKAMAAGLLLAVVSEGVQLFISGRTFNPVDLLANWIGVAAGAFVVKGMRWRAAL